MIMKIINGIAYVLYLAISGEWRGALPVPGSFKRAMLVTMHDMHIVKKLPAQGKYNDAQRIAYTGVILMGAASIELDHLNPELPTYVLCQGGYPSSLGTRILENASFKEIYNVTGGTKAWMDAGLDTEVSATACANS
jgi:rhodanese-related sulfurtransferase